MRRASALVALRYVCFDTIWACWEMDLTQLFLAISKGLRRTKAKNRDRYGDSMNIILFLDTMDVYSHGCVLLH